MGLRINTNIAALRSTRILRASTLDLNKSLERLSSGLRINKAGDDAAGLAIAEGFRSVKLGSAVAGRNALDGISFVQTIEGALSEVTNMLQRMRELAVQAANGTNSAQNRSDLDLEVQELVAQLNQVSQFTEFNGVFPLQTGTPLNLQVGVRPGQIITITPPIVAAGTLVPGITVAGVDATNANTAMGLVDAALLVVNTARARMGAAQNRLEFTIKILDIQEENSAASESVIRDADVARETITFTRNQILVSAGTSVLSQANVIPQNALQLLGG